MTRKPTRPAPSPPLPSPKERKRLREARHLTEEQVATAVGVTPATVRAWETGRTSPRGRRRAAYAKVIGSAEPPTPPQATATKAEVEADSGTGTGKKAEAKSAGSGPKSPRTPVNQKASVKSDASAPNPAPVPVPVPVPGTVPVRESVPDTVPAPTPEAPSAPAGLTAAEAFDALYTHTAPGLVRQAYVLTGRRNLARESVERAFQLAWHRWPEVAKDRDPAGWVRAAAYEYAMSPWNRVRRAHRRPDALPEEPGRRALLHALLEMPASYRRTLLLHDGVGLGLAETAAETEASTPAAAGRLMNARATVAERLPELARCSSPAGQSVVLRERLGALALAERVPAPSSAPVVRTGGERRAQRWTRATVCFGVLLAGATAFTLNTAPTHYEQPIAPAARVAGVPPLAGPEKLTAQDLKLQKALRGELAHGPERLVPQIP
ncbi:helix-turn-helix domain-containing protein [Streptomyces halstedii]|uniref:Helix-turn-helix domain-containing protein n=1 Tax=Streptomyces halstedii TaxID=1944 RepID=A0ABS6TQP6_STRHA|nr:helix-turn-helix domain-containing protein [Streptomyces halstedii]MBV7670519.1 helix-turn-helix domain-containing protein [Streptomyces halstedii]